MQSEAGECRNRIGSIDGTHQGDTDMVFYF